jgi:membrane protease YdiL (CAAX protease family)
LPAQAMEFALSAPGLLLAGGVTAVLLVGVALVAVAIERKPVAARLRLRPSRASVLGVAAAVVAMAGLSMALSAVSELLGVRGDDIMDQLAHALENPSPGRFAVSLVCISIGPGLAEETFFRGLLQPRLVARWGRTAGVVITAVGFGVFHFQIVQGTLAVFLGLLLGWLAERFDGIRPGMLVHAVNNALFLASAAWGSPEPGPKSVQAGVAAVGAAVFLGAMAVLRSRRALVATASTRAS